MMKLTVLLCVTVVMLSCHVALAKKKGGILDKIFNKNKKTKDDFKSNPNLLNQGSSVHRQDTPGRPFNQRPQLPAPGQGRTGEHGSYPAQGGFPRQGQYPAQGGYPGHGQYPAQGGYPGHGGYPAQGGYPGHGGYPAQGGYPGQGQYPAQGGYPGQGQYPAQGGYPGHGGHPAQGGYPGHGGYPAQGRYPGHGQYPAQGGYPGHGGYINRNPNNPILSPHYGGSYGGYDPGRGSPYSRTVQDMGYVPSEKSKGFGRSAVMAAAGGAMAGMALGYGLGKFPRPNIHFHSPQEEYYYNYYMYRRYGLKSPDGTDSSRDLKAPPLNYDAFMSSCMKRKDLLPTPKKRTLTSKTPPVTITAMTTTATTTSVSPSVSSNMTRNVTAHNLTSAVPTTSGSPKPYEVNPGASPGAPKAMAVSSTDKQEDDDDDNTVSVVEIGYPALIEQLKVRRCLELYIVHSEKYLRTSTTASPRGGGQQWESSHWLLLVLTFVIVIMS